MVVKLETVSALYADVYPGCAKLRGRNDSIQCMIPECMKRLKQQRPKSLPALIEDDAEPLEEYEMDKPRRTFVPHMDVLRRQHSLSPKRKERQRRQVLPSLSEDEEP